MILFEDKDGLCCRPKDQIASFTPAFPNRLRVETLDGCLGYCFIIDDYTQPGPCQYSGRDSFDPDQLRRIEVDGDNLRLTLASGETLNVTPKRVPSVRAFLGLDQYQPQPESLTRYFLREYPFEIARAAADLLRLHFPSARHLIANILWQTLERIRQGLPPYGTTHHGYFYKPLHATLERAGFINERLTKEASEELYERILARMVRDDGLFKYRDLGFEDRFANQREFGTRRPDIILVIEKDCLSDAGIAAARHCGISWIVTGGVARIVAVEFFCAALQLVHQGAVDVIDLGDFDPGGWLNGHTFVKHLSGYGIPCPRGPQFLIRPDLFTQEELELFSRPLSSKDGRVDDWLAESGGIAGQPRGIHADWLQPPERVLTALQALLGARETD